MPCNFIWIFLFVVFFNLFIGKEKNKVYKRIVKGYLGNFLKSFLSASGYICLINLFFIIIGMRGIYVNEWIVRIVCMISAWLVGKESKFKKWQIVVGVYLIDIVIGLILGFILFSFNRRTICW